MNENILPSLQRRGAFAQGFEMSESPSWVVGQSPTKKSFTLKKRERKFVQKKTNFIK